MTPAHALPLLEASETVYGPLSVWKVAVTESATVTLLTVALTAMFAQSRPAESMRGVVGFTVTLLSAGGFGLEAQLMPPAWQATNVTTCALGWLLTLPSALRTAT